MEKIIKNHEREEAIRTKNMSEEMLAKAKSQKPSNILKIEQLIKKINQNKTGVLVNGRQIRKPSEFISKRITQLSPLESNTHGDDGNFNASLVEKVKEETFNILKQ